MLNIPGAAHMRAPTDPLNIRPTVWTLPRPDQGDHVLVISPEHLVIPGIKHRAGHKGVARTPTWETEFMATGTSYKGGS